MTGFLKEFNLNKREPSPGHFALYDGKNFVFSENEWTYRTMIDVLWRYGLNFFKLKNYIEDMLDKFDK